MFFPFLTLDESTLFYWTLSDSTTSQKKKISAINKWASAIPTTSSGAKSTATSQAPKSTSSHGKADIPSLTCGTSHRSYAPSVLSNNVKIFSGQSSDAAVKAEPAVSIYNNGGLSDNEEIKGEEREFAIKSPPKGKKRITSEVFFFFLSLITIT